MRVTRRQLRRIIREAVGAAKFRRRARRISESSNQLHRQTAHEHPGIYIEPRTRRRLEQNLMRAFQEAAGEGAYPEELKVVAKYLAKEWLESFGTSSPTYVSSYVTMDARVRRKFENDIENALERAESEGAYPEAIFEFAVTFAEEWLWFGG